MEKKDWKTLAAILFCIAFFGVLAILFFRYVIAIFFPFLIAWGIAMPIYPVASAMSKKTGISRRICSFILLLVVILLIILLVFLIGNRLLFELQRAADWVTENSDAVVEKFEGFLESVNSLGQRIPILSQLKDIGFVEKIIENLDSLVTKIWEGFIENISRAVPDIAGGIVRSLPSVLIVSIVTVVSCFYFAADIDLVNGAVKAVIPRGIAKHLPFLKERVFYVLKKYIKAYFLLFLITFSELLLGFLILGIDYSFILSVVVALVDFLPILGTGTVLIPWSAVLLFSKNYFLGFGLLILYAIISIVRQVVEPRILGKSLGLHPIITLVGLYAGYRIFGFVGTFLVPFVLLIIFSILRAEKQKNSS